MAECDFTTCGLALVGKHDDAGGESSSAQQLRPVEGSSRDRKASSSPATPPASAGLSVSRRGNLGVSKIGKPFGRARLGRACLAKERSSGFVRMLKVRYRFKLMDAKTQLTNDQIHKQARCEVQIQFHLAHPSTLPLFGRFDDGYYDSVILGCAGGREMHEYLRMTQRLYEQRVAQYLAWAIAASEQDHVYMRRVAYGRIVSENALPGVHGEAEVSWHACLVHAPSHHRTKTWGGPDYSSPEVLASSAGDLFCNEKMDVWGLSVLMHELSVGNAPFEDVLAGTKYRVVIDGDQMPDFVSTEGRDSTMRVTHWSSDGQP
jgi:serine/threonine protein kinase